MLDEDSFIALKDYAIKRAYYIAWRKIRDNHLFLNLIPKNGSYAIDKSCVQSLVRRIKHELELSGCLWDLTYLNPQGCRRTAESAEFERAEYLPIPNAHLSIIGQFGHSMRVAEKHYWKKSKRNAYLLLKSKPAQSLPDIDKGGPAKVFDPSADFLPGGDILPNAFNDLGASI